MKNFLFFTFFIYNKIFAQQVSQKVVFPDASKINSYYGIKTINCYGDGGIIAALD